jgi:hypothetical protein
LKRNVILLVVAGVLVLLAVVYWGKIKSMMS